MADNSQKRSVEIKVEIDDVTAQGTYANLAFIAHSESEFTIDFIYVQPQGQKAKVRARIISSPGHTKRFLEALQENVKKFEESHGLITPSLGAERRPKFLS